MVLFGDRMLLIGKLFEGHRPFPFMILLGSQLLSLGCCLENCHFIKVIGLWQMRERSFYTFCLFSDWQFSIVMLVFGRVSIDLLGSSPLVPCLSGLTNPRLSTIGWGWTSQSTVSGNGTLEFCLLLFFDMFMYLFLYINCYCCYWLTIILDIFGCW